MAGRLVAAAMLSASVGLAQSRPSSEGSPDPWSLPFTWPLAWAAEAGSVRGVAAPSNRRPPAGTGPKLAPSWKANFSLSGKSAGTYFYDRPHQRDRQVLLFPMPMFHLNDTAHYDILTMNISGFNNNVTVGEGDDAVCKPSSVEQYFDPFDGIEFAERIGDRSIFGQPCTAWSFNSTDGVVQNSCCLRADGVPLEFNTSANIILGRSVTTFAGISHFRFFNITVGQLSDADFAPSSACLTNYPTKPCNDTGVVTLDLYRFHSLSEPFDLSNRNTGDALGDMSFVCGEDSHAGSNTSVVTHWQVDASLAWGQYAYCLYTDGKNVCHGGTGWQVGRESSYGMGKGHLQGQCSANDDTGSWYSFPEGGQCAPGQAIGTGNCTWGNARHVRTVTANCIFNDRGLLRMCKTERGNAPYTKSAEVLKAALASADPAKGGCPDASPKGLAFVV